MKIWYRCRKQSIYCVSFLMFVLTVPTIVTGSELLLASAPDDTKKMLGGDAVKGLMKSVMGSVLPLGISPQNLPDPKSRGAKLLLQYCTQCHELPSPGLHTADDWPVVVARMQQRILQLAKKELRLNGLSTMDEKTLLAYLQEHGYQAIDVSEYPELDTTIGIAFRTTCAQCHALPEPSIHTKEEWRAVVFRMRDNMKKLGVTDPGDAEISKIMSFLQVHARE